MFEKDAEFEDFERILAAALERVPGMRLLTYCVMPDHWHLVLWPRGDGELSKFVHWLSLTHTQRWHSHHKDAGTGHLYQGRYKSFPIQKDNHFLKLCRYVERNAPRAGLVKQAEKWRWCGLWRRHSATPQPMLLSSWPVKEPADWLQDVNRPQAEAELLAIRESVRRGRPYGFEAWSKHAARRLGLESTLRPRGRPRQEPARKKVEEKGT